jgi:hypothetical protein
MAKCLDQIIKGQQVIIPINVLGDARVFFGVVLGKETSNPIFNNNPPAQVNAFGIAWNVLKECPNLRPCTRKEGEGYFLKFAEFLEGLKNQPTVPLNKGWGKQSLVPLGTEDQKTANDLRDFFAALARKAEREDRH